jgi:TfoX/Sxy family transcriptional regulator of competence genes
MATDPGLMEFIADQLAGAGVMRYRRMFGAYAVYCDEKVVALVCEDRFYLKPTEAGRALLPEAVEDAPFDGARPWLLIEAELEDRQALQALVRATAAALPLPKPKKPRRKKA